MEKSSGIKWHWRISLGLGALLPLLLGLPRSLAYLPIESELPYQSWVQRSNILTSLIYLLVLLTLALIFIEVLRGIISKKSRPQVKAHLAGALVIIASLYVSGFVNDMVKKAGVERALANAAPLIEALGRHHTVKHSYPEDLKALVPGHIAAVPTPGSPALPPYEYESAAPPESAYKIRISVFGFMRSLQELAYSSAGPCSDENPGRECEAERCSCMGDWTLVVVE